MGRLIEGLFLDFLGFFVPIFRYFLRNIAIIKSIENNNENCKSIAHTKRDPRKQVPTLHGSLLFFYKLYSYGSNDSIHQKFIKHLSNPGSLL